MREGKQYKFLITYSDADGVINKTRVWASDRQRALRHLIHCRGWVRHISTRYLPQAGTRY
jgi:hypothetical protein